MPLTSAGTMIGIGGVTRNWEVVPTNSAFAFEGRCADCRQVICTMQDQALCESLIKSLITNHACAMAQLNNGIAQPVIHGHSQAAPTPICSQCMTPLALVGSQSWATQMMECPNRACASSPHHAPPQAPTYQAPQSAPVATRPKPYAYEVDEWDLLEDE